MPNQPATPKHGVRVLDDLWLAAKRVAEDRGGTVSEVVRRALEQYVRSYPLG